ncbi:MAG TPA: hypothetical protein VGR22_09260 [Thermomicrobiales bacterium]|nr:hypothetical protein [Thermomicrobiales bacterium]
MQPIAPPEVILLMHREMIQAELARQRRGRPAVASRPPAQPLRVVRARLGHALVAIGMRIDPSARQLPRPEAR